MLSEEITQLYPVVTDVKTGQPKGGHSHHLKVYSLWAAKVLGTKEVEDITAQVLWLSADSMSFFRTGFEQKELDQSEQEIIDCCKRMAALHEAGLARTNRRFRRRKVRTAGAAPSCLCAFREVRMSSTEPND